MNNEQTEWESAAADICSQLKQLPKNKKLVYVGRFCPMHFGHQAMISGVTQANENHLILVGSCNNPISHRNLFEFKDRIHFIKKTFPALKNIVGLPDFKGDNEAWFLNLENILTITGTHPSDAVFVGGCEEDVIWFRENNRQVHIINRFSGLTMNISGTEIRDHLITKNIEKLKLALDPHIIPDVLERFHIQWDKLKQL